MKLSMLLIAITASLCLSQTPLRYTDSLFTVEQTHIDHVYATAPELTSPYTCESSTQNTNLTMHVFQPVNDTLSVRPLLICTHGGAFISGNKEHDDMMAFCEEFAEKGYVTATIQYRLGMNTLSSISSERAVYRALQDSRAVVRYFKEFPSEFCIDTTNIYFLGSSAGAFMALHNVFMNEESERPAGSYAISNMPPTTDDGPDLGSLDAISPSYNHNAQPKAIIPLWGALQDTILIKPEDSGIPALLVHGTSDDIVPFGCGSPFGVPTLPPTYGSQLIAQRMANLYMEYETYFVPGEGHEFYGVTNGNWDPAPNAYWDTVLTYCTNFMYNQHKPEARFSYIKQNEKEVIFCDSSTGAVQWLWNFGDDSTSIEQNPIHIYNEDGDYTVKLTIWNNIQSWDTISTVISITSTSIPTKQGKTPERFALLQNYPNPFNPATTIAFLLPAHAQVYDVSLEIFDLNGQRIRTLLKDNLTAGKHQAVWDGRNDKGNLTGSGLYIYRLRAGSFITYKKMLLLK